MIRLFAADMVKIRHSLIPLIVIVIPLLVGGIIFLGISNVPEHATWQIISDGVSKVWAYFLLPMTITILTALLGQVEHRHNTWSYALSLPQARWQVFLTKGLIAVAIIALISVLIMAAVMLAGTVAGALNPDGKIYGSLPFEYFGRQLYRTWLASFLLIAVQFWVAMRFGGMALPLLFGIGGGTFAIVAAATSSFGIDFMNADYLPWLIPGNALSPTASERELAMLVGGAGGAAALVFVSGLLARKDWG